MTIFEETGINYEWALHSEGHEPKYEFKAVVTSEQGDQKRKRSKILFTPPPLNSEIKEKDWTNLLRIVR